MFHLDGETFVAMAIFAIPIVAIVGGITAGIVRTLGQQRIMELAQRERIAAIERGIDPAKLPPLPIVGSGYGGMGRWSDLGVGVYPTYRDFARQRAQGLMIGGLCTLFVGIALAIFLGLVNDGERGVWAVGLIPGGVGLALIISSLIVRPRDGDSGTPPQSPTA
ncbi:MAG: hypothetical protein HYR73_06395 [Candidatus Eisenbacteria bacterium]|nr:hypothetical protein [Candidatus Eisenbacteria bacterium]